MNAGQIPQLLYRVITPESVVSGRTYSPPDPVYILSSKFGRPLTTDSFQVRTLSSAEVKLGVQCKPYKYYSIKLSEFS